MINIDSSNLVVVNEITVGLEFDPIMVF